MKPNFALNFTDDAIVLLHRTARGWLDIGQTPFDAPDMAEALGYLRASALGLSPQGMTTKLVIPNGQILYTEVEAPGPDTASRKAQIRAALEGRTPYGVDDLVFDWWGKGPRLQVAVVARETLEEAEAFAVAHRLNPVSFVAIPEQGSFVGEPFFGQTQASAKLLAAGESVTRDQDPIQIVAREVVPGQARPTAAEPESAVKPAAQEAPAPATDVAAPEKPADETAAPEKAAPAKPVPEAAAPAVAKPVPEARAPGGETAAAPSAPPVAPAPVAPAPVTPPATAPTPAAPAPAAPAAAVPAPAAPAATQPVQVPPAATPAPAFSSRRRDDIAQIPPLGAATRAMPPTPPVQAKAQAPAPAAEPKPAAAPAPSVLGQSVAEASAVAPAVAEGMPATPPAQDKAAPPPARAPGPDGRAGADLPPAAKAAEVKPAAPPVSAATPAPAAPVAAPKPEVKPLSKPVAPTPPRPGITERPAARASKPLAAMVTAASIPGLRGSAKPATAGAKDAAKPAKPAADPLAMRAARPRGKPKYLGLVLTGILLLFLAMIAAWSSFYLSRDEGASEDPEIQTAAAPVARPDGSIVAPDAVNLSVEAVEPAMSTDIAAANAPPPVEVPPVEVPPVEAQQAETLPLAQPEAQPEDQPETVAEATAPAAPEPVAEAAAPLAATEAAPADTAEVAAAEPAPAATSEVDDNRMVAAGAVGQDEIFLAGRDAPPPAFDAVALPVPLASADAPPAPVVPPPPPGAIYEFDADGRIIPTERGVVTPSGFWLIAARPDPLPPPRPAALSAPTVAPEVAPETAATEPAPETTAAAITAAPPVAEPAAEVDPALTAVRPRARPASVVPPPAAAEPDDAGLIPPTDPRFAAVRPRERPASVAARADEARLASEAASLAVATALAEPAVQQGWDPNASPLAVSLSRRPAARPADLSRAVEAAAAAAVRPQEGPALDPEEEEELEVAAAAAPRIPTRASVAKQATFTNAINLSRLNLIGIYGTPSNRSALVRSSNGRYTKVEVGDRLDGGRVAAITASELRYEKGGRMLVLEMPRG